MQETHVLASTSNGQAEVSPMSGLLTGETKKAPRQPDTVARAGAVAVKRVNLNIPEIAYEDAVNAARAKGWNLTQFILFALGLAVRITDETAQGARLFLKNGDGERELLLPKY